MERMQKEKSAQARHDKKKRVTSPSSLAFRGKQLVFPNCEVKYRKSIPAGYKQKI